MLDLDEFLELLTSTNEAPYFRSGDRFTYFYSDDSMFVTYKRRGANGSTGEFPTRRLFDIYQNIRELTDANCRQDHPDGNMYISPPHLTPIRALLIAAGLYSSDKPDFRRLV